MKRQTGLWIDHREAFLVLIRDGMEVTEHITSGVEKHVRYSGHAALEEGTADDQRDRQFSAHLETYYDEVIVHLHNAGSIYLFGPGEAKGELQKRLISKGLSERLVGVETVDKMSPRQIAAKVRAFYQQPA